MKTTTTGVRRTLQAALAIVTFIAVMAGAMHPAQAAPSASPAAAGSWHPPACPPPADRGTGRSSIKVTGPCGFEHTGEADCQADGDDMMLVVARKAKKGAEVMLYVNVERYVGPGVYKAPNDLWVSHKDGSKIYRWWSNKFEVTVGPESKYVTLNDVHLEPELLLVGCTGPQTNYQCDGRGDEPRLMETSTTVTGTLYCKTLKKKK